jgi:hypothetical protein
MIELYGYDQLSITDEIKLPRIEEIIRAFPFYQQGDLWGLYKYGNVDLIKILDSVPLTNKFKYISVDMKVQLLSPNVTPAPRGNWHFDANGFREEDESIAHLLVSDTTSLTEFTTEEIVLNQFDESSSLLDVELYMNQNTDSFSPVAIQPNRFVSFNGARHLHRAVRAKGQEFRFFLRVLESNHMIPYSFKDAVIDFSRVYNDGIQDYSKITRDYILNNHTNSYPSIDRKRNQAIIHVN